MRRFYTEVRELGLLKNITNRVLGTKTKSEVSNQEKQAMLRKCYFEVMEQRRVLSADPVIAAVTYLEEPARLLLHLIGVDSVLESGLNLHYLPFWSSLYSITTDIDTEPTVDTNLDRVQRVGSLDFSDGNSSLNSWEVNLLILLTTRLMPICGFTSSSRWTWSGITAIPKTRYP